MPPPFSFRDIFTSYNGGERYENYLENDFH